jgi:hypothetical protein
MSGVEIELATSVFDSLLLRSYCDSTFCYKNCLYSEASQGSGQRGSPDLDRVYSDECRHEGFNICLGLYWSMDTSSDQPVRNYLSEISGSHGSEYEDDCLLGCCAVKSGRSLPTFQRCLVPLSSGRSWWIIALMMEAASTSETSVNFRQTTWHNNLEDSHTQSTFSDFQTVMSWRDKILLERCFGASVLVAFATN